MNNVFLLAQIAQPSGIGEAFEKFGVNVFDFFSQAICFLILAYVLNRFVFKPVMKIVDQRRRDAEEASANNDKIRKILKESEDASSDIISKAYEHAEKLIMETKADIDVLREQEMIRTEKLAVQILEKAREESILHQEKLKLELRNEIAEVIVHLTGVLTERNLKKQDKERERLIDSAISALSAEISAGKSGISK